MAKPQAEKFIGDPASNGWLSRSSLLQQTEELITQCADSFVSPESFSRGRSQLLSNLMTFTLALNGMYLLLKRLNKLLRNYSYRKASMGSSMAALRAG